MSSEKRLSSEKKSSCEKIYLVRKILFAVIKEGSYLAEEVRTVKEVIRSDSL